MSRDSIRKVFLGLLVVGMTWAGQASCAQVDARVFVNPPNNEIHMASGGTSWFINVEPVNGNFQVTDVNACTVKLWSSGNGFASSIDYDCTKTTLVSDSDGNGVQDIRFGFLKTAMAPLFSNLHGASPKTVQMLLTGNNVNGDTWGNSVLVTLYLHN